MRVLDFGLLASDARSGFRIWCYWRPGEFSRELLTGRTNAWVCTYAASKTRRRHWLGTTGLATPVETSHKRIFFPDCMSSRRRLVDGLLRSFCTSLVFWSYAIVVKSTPSPNVVSKTSNTIDGCESGCLNTRVRVGHDVGFALDETYVRREFLNVC